MIQTLSEKILIREITIFQIKIRARRKQLIKICNICQGCGQGYVHQIHPPTTYECCWCVGGGVLCCDCNGSYVTCECGAK